jgi:hypothetical protein
MTTTDDVRASSQSALKGLILTIVPKTKEARLHWARFIHEVADEIHRLAMEMPSERSIAMNRKP